MSDNGHRERELAERDKKRGFWGSKDKEKDKERDRGREYQMRDREREMPMARERERPQEHERGREPRRDDDGQAELTRMIGESTTFIAHFTYSNIWLVS